jgi:hypothetical protein
MARLEDTLLADPRPAVLVAHSLGCHLAAAWAAHSRHATLVLAALLVAPPDLGRADLPPQLHGWSTRMPQDHGRALPFASTAVLSSDDPFSDAAASLRTAAGWGSEIVTLGPAGHVNADSGLGDWPEGLALLRALLRRAGAGPLPADG